MNTETGEELSRRQADKLLNRIEGSYERKAKANKTVDLVKSLSRPARGRKKINPETEFEELESRVFNERLKKVHTRKINRQLLKTGHRAERVNFFTYDQYKNYMDQIKNLKAPNGRPLIMSVGIGMTGHSIRSSNFGERLDATIDPMRLYSDVLTESQFESIVEDWLAEHDYVEIDWYWLHLHFNREYAESRVTKAQKRKLKKMGLR